MTPSWKKIAVTGLAACAFLLSLALVAARFGRHATPAKQTPPWNSQAIEGTPAGIRVQEIDPTHAAVTFLYDLDNKTDTDYHLVKGPNIVVMSRLKPGGTLSADEPITLDSAAFVPARNRTRIALKVSHLFNWPGQSGAYAERQFNQLVTGDITRCCRLCAVRSDESIRDRLPCRMAGNSRVFVSPLTERSGGASAARGALRRWGGWLTIVQNSRY